jgi:hypothetical protein
MKSLRLVKGEEEGGREGGREGGGVRERELGSTYMFCYMPAFVMYTTDLYIN